MHVKRMKATVIGCGAISHVYLRNLTELLSIVEVVAVCDLNRNAAEASAQRYGIPAVLTLEEIARDASIEMAINLTGPAAHYGTILAMLNAGKHVYTEKPMTAELWEAAELVKLAADKGLYLAVAPDTVLGAGIQTARQAMDQGVVGTPTSFVMSINRNQSENSEIFRFLQQRGGSLPYDVGIYYIASLVALMGPVSEVYAYAMPASIHKAHILTGENEIDLDEHWRIPGNNLVAATVRMANGTVGTVHFNGNTTNEQKHILTIFGTEGVLEVGNPETFGGRSVLTKPNAAPVVLPFTHGYDGTPVEGALEDESRYGHRGIGVAELAWSIRMGRVNRLSKEYGYHVLEILSAFDSSAETGKPVRLQSAFEMRPLASGYFSKTLVGAFKGDAERSLIE